MKPKVHKTVYEAVQVRLLHQLFLSYAVYAAAYDNFDKSNWWRKWIFFVTGMKWWPTENKNNKMKCTLCYGSHAQIYASWASL